jgi:hypothetical protein
MDINHIHADEIGDAAAFKTAMNKSKGHRTCFTKREAALQTSIADLAAHTDNNCEDNVRKGLNLLEEAHLRLENAFCYCLALLTEDPDGENTTILNNKIDALTRETTQIRAEVYRAISDCRKAVAAGAVVPPTYKMNFNSELKPFDLSLSNMPPEFRMWKDKMETYFSLNNLKRAPAPVQVNYVRKCLDLDLVSRIGPSVDNKIPVYTIDTGLLALLDKVVETQYPLVTKRLTWASCKQTQGETLDAFIDRYCYVL